MQLDLMLDEETAFQPEAVSRLAAAADVNSKISYSNIHLATTMLN